MSTALCKALILVGAARAAGQEPTGTLRIRRVAAPPSLDDVRDPKRAAAALEGFSRVTGFVQRIPHDGTPAVQQTVVYLAYTRDAVHAVFLAKDSTPRRIRARLVPREQIAGDDIVGLLLDTDRDGRRAYAFRSNPRGVQWDALYTEGQGYDESFDALWESDARVMEWGYVVHMAIPFRSLRFAPAEHQQWAVVLSRRLARESEEETYWPRVSSSVQGILTQSAALSGIQGISPGRNMQTIPYGTYRAFRAVDAEAEGGPRFVDDFSDLSLGGDFKAILDERFVLDLTANPDFSQVESDQPQRTVNQRFEVFFPERRPFFMENADYFRTPLRLLFTRRILDPLVGARFTGKAGPWGVGALVTDDEGPGRIAEGGNDSEGARAWFGAGRLSLDVGDHSTVGGMAVANTFAGSFNGVGGFDTRLRLDDHWTVSGQAAFSSSVDTSADGSSGTAYLTSITRSDRNLFLTLGFSDITPDFEAGSGFVPRTDLRRLSHFSSYFWRPGGGSLTSWGPELFAQALWDHTGLLLDDLVEGSLEWNFLSNTGVEINYRRATERLRPRDHPALESVRAYDTSRWDLELQTSLLRWLDLDADIGWGLKTHLTPTGGAPPETGDWHEVDATLSFRPTVRLRVDNDLIWARLGDRSSGATIFEDWIVRTRWNWQSTRELSVRAIVQFEDTRSDPDRTTVTPRRALNGDLLITYRVNPWTAVYAGVNANAVDRTLVETSQGRAFRRTPGLRLDARQVFLKVTYLLRF